MNTFIIERNELDHLFEMLKQQSYNVIGPTVRDGAIVYEDLNRPDELPIGWTDEQTNGFYRLKRRNDAAVFGWTVGPQSWKKFLFPPTQKIFSTNKSIKGFNFSPSKKQLMPDQEPRKYAFFGVRACEIQAIAIQDKILLGGPFKDLFYEKKREGIFIVAVNCGQAGGTCFCASMNAGPKATAGFDLALTEILNDGRHYFVLEVGTERGGEVLRNLKYSEASQEECATANTISLKTTQQMGRTLETSDLKNFLYRNSEHPRWEHVAARCLTCANCTMVCPTCFCTTVEDVTELAGKQADRIRKWDSCFTLDFSYIHGGSVRTSAKSRYRQWLTHKLASWVDQFGSFGCVGCGRCITWCPVGIDITEEVKSMSVNQS